MIGVVRDYSEAYHRRAYPGNSPGYLRGSAFNNAAAV